MKFVKLGAEEWCDESTANSRYIRNQNSMNLFVLFFLKGNS